MSNAAWLTDPASTL